VQNLIRVLEATLKGPWGAVPNVRLVDGLEWCRDRPFAEAETYTTLNNQPSRTVSS